MPYYWGVRCYAWKLVAKAKLFEPTMPFDFGTQVSVPVKKLDGGPLIATLEDGTVLEVRTVIVEVKRSKDRYDSKGDPVYAVATAQVIAAKPPRKLKIKKVKK